MKTGWCRRGWRRLTFQLESAAWRLGARVTWRGAAAAAGVAVACVLLADKRVSESQTAGEWVMFLVQLLVAVGMAVAAYFLAPKPKMGDAGAASISVPTADEGVPIAVGFGTYEISGQHIWPRIKETTPKSKNNSNGQWRMSIATALGIGPIKRLEQIRWDDCVIMDTPVDYNPDAHPNGFATVPHKRASGIIRFYFGQNNAVADSHIVNVVLNGGTSAQTENDENLRVPKWRYIAYVVYEMIHVGVTAGAPNAAYRVVREPQSPLDPDGLNGLLPETRMIGAHANPVHVMAELMTNKMYGAGIPLDKFDWPSWNAAAERCQGENLGISGAIKTLEMLDDFLKSILFHIDGGFVRRGNKIVLRLLRSDSVPNPDANIAENDVVDCEHETGATTSVVNHISVQHPMASRDFRETITPVFDAGNAFIRDNTRREVIKFPYFTDLEIARSVAGRKSQMLMTPHDALKLTLRRKAAYNLEWGDVITVTFPKMGITPAYAWRVMGVERSARGAGGYAEVSCVEEVGESVHTLTQPEGGGSGGGGGGGGGINSPVTHQLPMELPYWWNTAGDVRMTYLANRESQTEDGFFLHGRKSDSLNYTLWHSNGVFVLAGTANTTNGLEIDDSNDGILVTKVVQTLDWEDFFNAFFADSREQFLESPSYYAVIVTPALGDLVEENLRVWRHEIIAFQAIYYEGLDSEGDAIYRLRGIKRRLFDTSRLDSGEIFVLPRGAPVPFEVTPKAEFVAGNTIIYKAQPFAGLEVADLDAMTTRQILVQRRSAAPYAAQNLAVDGNGSNPSYSEAVAARLTWTHRNRTTGCGIDDTFDNNAGVAESISFIVRIYAPDDTLLLEDNVPSSQTTVDSFGVTRFYYDFTIASGGHSHIVTKVYALRGGVESIDELDDAALRVKRL